MATTVVHIREGVHDIYIGRQKQGMHFGNPFSHLGYGLAVVRVGTREESIRRFRSWILGKSDTTVEPERRLWILKNLHQLKDKKLGCYCSPNTCHGDVLAELADKEQT